MGAKAHSDDEIEVMLGMWNLGYSASQIAIRMGELCNREFTRCGVIGVAHRRNFPTRATSMRKPRPSQAKDPAAFVLPKPKPEPVIPAKDIIPIGLDLTDLNEKHCHWPYGDAPPFTFCGHQPLPGKNLCGGHWVIAHPKQPAHGAGNGSGMRSDRQFQT